MSLGSHIIFKTFKVVLITVNLSKDEVSMYSHVLHYITVLKIALFMDCTSFSISFLYNFCQCCLLTKVPSVCMTLWAYKNCGFTISSRTQALLVGDGTLGRTGMWLAWSGTGWAIERPIHTTYHWPTVEVCLAKAHRKIEFQKERGAKSKRSILCW